jgi:hypothetical protein
MPLLLLSPIVVLLAGLLAPLHAQTPPAAEAQAAGAVDGDAVRRRLATLWEGALLDSGNGQDFAETAGYRRLLEFVTAADAGVVAERAQLLDREQALQRPDELRGEHVLVRGLLADLWAERLDRPLGEHVDVWRGVVTDTDGSDGTVFDVVGWPGKLETAHDVVEVRGVFYRTVRYINARDEAVETPYIIAHSVSLMDTRAPKGNTLLRVLIVAALAYLVFRVVLMIRRRQRTPAHDDPASVFRRHLRPPPPAGPGRDPSPPSSADPS